MKRLNMSIFAALLSMSLGYVHAADVKISALPAAAALGGTEAVPAVQSGATVKTTPAALATYVQSVGTLAVARGGTGANTLTGLLLGNGTSAFTPAASANVISLFSGTCNTTTFLRGDGSCNTPFQPTGAAPSATIGLTAVIGSAPTFLPSDSAPALSQTIAPTWTGLHTWSSTEPRLLLNQTGAVLNTKLWDWDVASTVLTGRTRTDADAAGKTWIAVSRAGTAITDISVANSTDNPTLTFLGSGQVNFNGNVALNNGSLNAGGNVTATAGILTTNLAAPLVRWQESDQGTDLKRWQWAVESAVMKLQTVTDLNAAGVDIMSVTRGTTTNVSAITLGNATSNPTFGWLGTGTFSVGSNISMSSGGTITATAVNVNGTSVPATGIYRPATNQLAFSTNTLLRGMFDANGMFIVNSGVMSAGTKFTTTGCSVSATAGGATAGTFTLGANTCSVVITFAGATGATATTGWNCQAHNRVAAPVALGESASTTTTATIPIPVTVGATDVVSFSCIAF